VWCVEWHYNSTIVIGERGQRPGNRLFEFEPEVLHTGPSELGRGVFEDLDHLVIEQVGNV
jgi:hypothetical protein